jgi:hypothetical protein
VGGHYSAGEGPETAGPREIFEELGLTIPFTSLVPMGRRVFVYCFTPGVQECEFQDVFLLPLAGSPAGLLLQKEEVDAVLEMDVEQGIRLLCAEVPALESVVTRSSGAGETIVLRADMFVPCLDNYYLKLLLVAQRYAGGDRRGLVI